MDENEVLINALDNYQNENGYDNFDDMIIKEYFAELTDTSDVTRLKTDSYGDAGVDYTFCLCNKNQFYELDELSELIQGNSNLIDFYIIQIKDSKKLDSNVPNKFIELANNMRQGNKKLHYNEEINDFINLFSSIVTKYALKAKINIHYYYFSKASKLSLSSATDLTGRFLTLKDIFKDSDYIGETYTDVFGTSDIFQEIKKDKKFEYVFKDIEKFEAEINIKDGKANGIIALVPIKQFYNFIKKDDHIINENLFENNIRDFKGNSIVNKNIASTLSSKYENSQKNSLDFWWLNNGVTITVEELSESKTAKQIRIVNPQIVNGLQTSYSIFDYFKSNPNNLEAENRKVFVKILQITPDIADQELDIIVATNSQNEIRDKNIRANDDVQKKIEEFFKQNGKYYQRKDKYYTNRKLPKSDIIKLSDLAKYLNTIYLKDPSFTRNNPGKLLRGKKYEAIFKIDDEKQNYQRYLKAYQIYTAINQLYKGKININDDQFDKQNFLHHIVYVVVVILNSNVNYTTTDVISLNLDDINEDIIIKAEGVILNVIYEKQISNAQILKAIKEQSFTQKLNKYLIDMYEGIPNV